MDYDYNDKGETICSVIEQKVTFPKPPSRPRPDWFDTLGEVQPSLSGFLGETYRAYDDNCMILTAIGLRTALDSCVTAVKIDPAKTFEEKLQELRKGGYIGDTEHDLLQVLTNAGNAAAHRGWSPNPADVDHLLDVLETFIKRVLVNGKRALAIKDGIPHRPKRLPALAAQSDTPAG